MLLFQPSDDGGISEYMHAQANELARRGLRVVMLASPRFLAAHPDRSYEGRGRLVTVPPSLRGRLVRRVAFALCVVLNPYVLASHVAGLRPRFVLLDAMSELLAPFWAWPHLLLARLRVTRYVATLHDPVRERRHGPAWWHRLSLRAAQAPLSIGLVHDLRAAAKAGTPAHMLLVEVPHGVFAHAPARRSTDIRALLGIDRAATVALSFGYVADRKNLGLAIEALARVPDLHLIVAGRRGSNQDRPINAYKAQAKTLGVADRCHFVDRFIGKDELDGFFRAADFLLLAYTASFVSQSGVLHVAANWNLPVLAAGGAGPMLDAVRRFGLGEVVEPDSVDALARGIERMISRDRGRDADDEGWRQFRENASWRRNVDLLLAAVEREEGRAA